MFRSQSGPGALSINTQSANSLSSQSSLPPPSGGKSLFGSTNTATTTAQPPTSSLFGASGTATQPQSTPSLFGTTQTQAGSAQPQQPGGGLFGSQQPQQTSNNMFNNTQQSQPQPGLGLFGSTHGQAQNQQPSGNLFGSAHNPSKRSIFDNIQGQAQNQQSSMQPPPQPLLFSATIGQHAQQQQTAPGVRISVNELRPTTRFNDLHEELQKAIEYVDSFILNKIQWKDACESEGEAIDTMCLQLPPDVEYCTKQLDTMQQALENDAEAIAFAKDIVKTDAADAKLSFKVIQNLRLPPQFHQTSLWSTAMAPQQPRVGISDEGPDGGASRNLVEYFSKQTDTMSKSLEDYKQHIAEVEDYLHSMESTIMSQMYRINFTRGQIGSSRSAEDQVRELAAVLRAFENGILGVAAKVGGTRESIQDVMLGNGVNGSQMGQGGRIRAP